MGGSDDDGDDDGENAFAAEILGEVDDDDGASKDCFPLVDPPPNGWPLPTAYALE